MDERTKQQLVEKKIKFVIYKLKHFELITLKNSFFLRYNKKYYIIHTFPPPKQGQIFYLNDCKNEIIKRLFLYSKQFSF